jgi:hypothetical protein
MKNLAVMVALAGAMVFATGCGSDPMDTEVDAAAIESAFGVDGSAAAEAPAEEGSTTDSIEIPAGPGADVPIEEVATRAASAIRRDDVTEAIVMLQTLRRARNLSPGQLTAVQDQMAALQMSLANRAAI